jgi:cytochrome c biogenesis protein CcmG/thiol:disulfide interchange protein DsbE
VIALVALVVAAGLVAALATRPQATATEVISPLVGREAPAIDATTIYGAHFDLASYRGRFVVLNFFATWCPPCQTEEPNLVEFAYQHRSQTGPALVGVVFADTAANARAFFRSTGATWPAVADPSGKIALAYGVRGPPETFVIAPDGVILAHIDGPLTVKGLDQVLERARSTYG